MQEAAAEGVFPKGKDVFLWKFHGLFPGAPLRIHSCADCGSRGANSRAGNFAVLPIWPRSMRAIIWMSRRGRTCNSRDFGGKGLRNPYRPCRVGDSSIKAQERQHPQCDFVGTSGFDADELIDTLPYAKAMPPHILNDRECTACQESSTSASTGRTHRDPGRYKRRRLPGSASRRSERDERLPRRYLIFA